MLRVNHSQLAKKLMTQKLLLVLTKKILASLLITNLGFDVRVKKAGRGLNVLG